MGFLKRLFGSEDALAEARAEERAADAPEPSAKTVTTGQRPEGWGEVETSQEGSDLLIALPALGLEEDSISLEPHGSSLKLHAKGSGAHGEQIQLNESLALPEGSDASQASVSYTAGKLVIRIPKSALKSQAG